MKISSLYLRNFRLIGDAGLTVDFNTGRTVSILLGDNGCGKTSVLDGIAMMLSPFMAMFPGVSEVKPSSLDVHNDREGRLAPYLEIKALFEMPDGTVSAARRRRGWDRPPLSDIKEIRLRAQELAASVHGEAGKLQALPVLAYYGTGRGRIATPQRKRGFRQTPDRSSCYINALSPDIGFSSFFNWFDTMEDRERRECARRRDFDYKLPALQAVRKAITDFTGPVFHSPRIEINPLRFVMTENSGICMDRDIRIEQMSDGYKTVIAMVADIAARMAEANPHLDNPLNSDGIVLIDEIDLHLHPSWQRSIVGKLASTFPNIQFILTTHSPIVVAGAADVAQIIHIGNDRRTSDDVSVEYDLMTMDIGQILLSDLFGLKTLRSPIWDDHLSRRDTLLAQATLTDVEKAELSALNAELSALRNGDSPADIMARDLLQKIASEIGLTP